MSRLGSFLGFQNLDFRGFTGYGGGTVLEDIEEKARRRRDSNRLLRKLTGKGSFPVEIANVRA